MDEDIRLSIALLDEAEAFGRIEELNDSGFHGSSSLKSNSPACQTWHPAYSDSICVANRGAWTKVIDRIDRRRLMVSYDHFQGPRNNSFSRSLDGLTYFAPHVNSSTSRHHRRWPIQEGSNSQG